MIRIDASFHARYKPLLKVIVLGVFALRWHTVKEPMTTFALAQWLEIDESVISEESLRRLFRRHLGNIRDVIRTLYDEIAAIPHL